LTALSFLSEGSRVGSRGINVVRKDKVKDLRHLPDHPKEEGDGVMKKMEEMDLTGVEDLLFMLIAGCAMVLDCTLHVSLFNIFPKQLIDGVEIAYPAKYYKATVIPRRYEPDFLELTNANIAI
jgi:hypothetical protein